MSKRKKLIAALLAAAAAFGAAFWSVDEDQLRSILDALVPQEAPVEPDSAEQPK